MNYTREQLVNTAKIYGNILMVEAELKDQWHYRPENVPILVGMAGSLQEFLVRYNTEIPEDVRHELKVDVSSLEERCKSIISEYTEESE